ncbi:hypothetical protein P9D43_25315 [Neobacillus niacini]|uniref:hypothetical protein n=1 Tax=Neobacillus niacini TaxID=86668 RepID=UPI0012F80229|nr:hypothetical protein [Neobacillus niacini]MEC1525321.1 hypothetical protein [Neobacillus niacini]
MSNKHYEKGADIIFIMIQIICIIALFKIKNFDYMRMASGNLIFWLVYMIVEKKANWGIPFYIRVVTLLSITLNDILGEYFNLFVTSQVYDRIQHIFGTYALTLWIYFVLQQFIQIKLTSKRLTIILFISLALALGTIYELMEFMDDEVYHPKIKNQPSLLDTNLDLLSDFIGGIIAVFHYYLSNNFRSFRFPFEQRRNFSRY